MQKNFSRTKRCLILMGLQVGLWLPSAALGTLVEDLQEINDEAHKSAASSDLYNHDLVYSDYKDRREGGFVCRDKGSGKTLFGRTAYEDKEIQCKVFLCHAQTVVRSYDDGDEKVQRANEKWKGICSAERAKEALESLDSSFEVYKKVAKFVTGDLGELPKPTDDRVEAFKRWDKWKRYFPGLLARAREEERGAARPTRQPAVASSSSSGPTASDMRSFLQQMGKDRR